MPGNVPSNPKLYRIVHWQNVSYIVQHGMFKRHHPQADPNYVDIGNKQLIGHRHAHPIPNFPLAGNLGDCVPFYFGAHSPMLYAIRKGAAGVQMRPQEDIVYIVSSVNTIVSKNLVFYFTDQHAKTSLAMGFDNWNDLTAIDWNLVLSTNWANTNTDMNKRDRKQAEFLVLNHVPPSCIEVIVVKTSQRQQQIAAIVAGLNSEIPVILDASLYF